MTLFAAHSDRSSSDSQVRASSVTRLMSLMPPANLVSTQIIDYMKDALVWVTTINYVMNVIYLACMSILNLTVICFYEIGFGS